MTKGTKITIRYAAVDGFSQVRSFYTLKLAQAYAVDRLGDAPDLAGAYAVSPDGVGTITVDGARLEDLFPTPEVVYPAGRPGFNGVPVTVYEDGSDNYT